MAAIILAKRNLRIYFRDRSAVFFSLLAVFIILGLYLVFLGDVWTESLSDVEGAKELMNSWIVAGLLTVTGVTTTLGAFSVMVDDRVRKVSKDFSSTPVSKISMAGGYICSAFLIGLLMSILTFVLGELYIVLVGGRMLPPGSVCKVLGLIVLNTMTSTSIVLFIVSLIGSINAFSNISIVIGTLIGFLTGMYLPIGQLPDWVQFGMKCFPITYSAGMFRQVMMEREMAASFEGISAEYLREFQIEMGNVFVFGDYTVSPELSVLFLLITTGIFFMLSVFRLSRKIK